MKSKNPKFAATLSIITGLGQIYNGEIRNGIIFFIAEIIIFSYFGIGIASILWIYSIVDAYWTAEEINKKNAVDE